MLPGEPEPLDGILLLANMRKLLNNAQDLSGIEDIMEESLTPLKTTTTSDLEGTGNHLTQAKPTQDTHSGSNQAPNSPEAALEILLSKPDLTRLTRVLRWLDPKTAEDAQFNIKVPGPKAAQLVNVLVNDIVPDYWTILSGQHDYVHVKPKLLMLRCLSSVSGIGAITARLRSLLNSNRNGRGKNKVGGVDESEPMRNLHRVLESILERDTFIISIWTDITLLIPNVAARDLLWKELLSVLATGRLLSIAAEASEILNMGSSSVENESWIGSGNEYSSWLGRNVGVMAIRLNEGDDGGWKGAARLVAKGLKLGYIGKATSSIIPVPCI